MIRQLALVMLALSAVVALGLRFLPKEEVHSTHASEQSQAALRALLGAIDVAPNPPQLMPSAAELSELASACPLKQRHQGLPLLEDMAENLELLDRQLARQTAVLGVRNAPLKALYQLDVAAWKASILTGRVSCPAAAHALRQLAGPRGDALLAQQHWREHGRQAGRPKAAGPMAGASSPTGGEPVPAVSMATGTLTQGDPWKGWPGCVWLGASDTSGLATYVAPSGRASWGRTLCETPKVAPEGSQRWQAATALPSLANLPLDNPAWRVPPSLDALLAELNALRTPLGPLYGHYAARTESGTNRRSIGKFEVDAGFNIELTLDPRAQALAQQMAECYTGRLAVCSALGIDPKQVAAADSPGARAMWEQAGARMTGIAILDVPSGRIEALASAHSPCYAQDHDGPGRDAGCPPLWQAPRRRPDALLNHAVFTDYLPGSTIKPILATVFFEDPGIRREALESWLKHSSSQPFMDELFCLPWSNPAAKQCDRPRRAQARAQELGWNTGCESANGPACGMVDILFGRPLEHRSLTGETALDELSHPLQRTSMGGRLMVEPTNPDQFGAALVQMKMPDVSRSEAESAKENCRNSEGWSAEKRCASGFMMSLINEGYGQGNARTTALGVAGMMARIAAAARGLPGSQRPHLVSRITDADGNLVKTFATRLSDADDSPSGVSPVMQPLAKAPAQAVLDALQKASQDGTGSRTCKLVFGPRCKAAGNWFAGKTGTPTFSLGNFRFDKMTYQAVGRQVCPVGRAQPAGCAQRPMKWYVAAYKSEQASTNQYDKVIAVLSERNFYLPGQAAGQQQMQVHGMADKYNISTEIGMRILDNLVIREQLIKSPPAEKS